MWDNATYEWYIKDMQTFHEQWDYVQGELVCVHVPTQLPVMETVHMVEEPAHKKLRAEPEAELRVAVRQWVLSKGGQVSGSAIGQRFGQTYNTLIRVDSGKNDGQFKKWLATIPGIAVLNGTTSITWAVQVTQWGPRPPSTPPPRWGPRPPSTSPPR